MGPSATPRPAHRSRIDAGPSAMCFLLHHGLRLDRVGDLRWVRALGSALSYDVDQPVQPAGCFLPRHGLRVRSGAETLDLVTSYECSQTRAYRDAAAPTTIVHYGYSKPVFDQLLRSAGIATSGSRSP